MPFGPSAALSPSAVAARLRLGRGGGVPAPLMAAVLELPGLAPGYAE